MLPIGEQYLEHDIYPFISGVGRGAERIVVDMTNGRGWFTSDHYESFTELLEEGVQDAEQVVEEIGPAI